VNGLAGEDASSRSSAASFAFSRTLSRSSAFTSATPISTRSRAIVSTSRPK
jgi:hypothetical protein